MGGHLATFTSDDDWDNMLSEVGIENISSNHTWLGATDEDEVGNWKHRWVTGEPFEFSRWTNGQPGATLRSTTLPVR